MEQFIAFLLSLLVLVPMAWFAWESTVVVSNRKNKYGISSGEQESKKKHMDDIL